MTKTVVKKTNKNLLPENLHQARRIRSSVPKDEYWSAAIGVAVTPHLIEAIAAVELADKLFVPVEAVDVYTTIDLPPGAFHGSFRPATLFQYGALNTTGGILSYQFKPLADVNDVRQAKKTNFGFHTLTGYKKQIASAVYLEQTRRGQYRKAWKHKKSDQTSGPEVFPPVWVRFTHEVDPVLLYWASYVDDDEGNEKLPIELVERFVSDVEAGMKLTAPCDGRYTGTTKAPAGVSRPDNDKFVYYEFVVENGTESHVLTVLKGHGRVTCQPGQMVRTGDHVGFGCKKLPLDWDHSWSAARKLSHLLYKCEVDPRLMLAWWLGKVVRHGKEFFLPYDLACFAMTRPDATGDTVRNSASFHYDFADMTGYDSDIEAYVFSLRQQRVDQHRFNLCGVDLDTQPQDLRYRWQ